MSDPIILGVMPGQMVRNGSTLFTGPPIAPQTIDVQVPEDRCSHWVHDAMSEPCSLDCDFDNPSFGTVRMVVRAVPIVDCDDPPPHTGAYIEWYDDGEHLLCDGTGDPAAVRITLPDDAEPAQWAIVGIPAKEES